MVFPQRILVLGTSTNGGSWPPLAAVTVGLHQAGHAVQCFADTAIAQEFAAAAVALQVVHATETLRPFIMRWRATGGVDPSPLQAWADACLPAVRALVSDFKPGVVLSELFTMELARLTKAACGLRWCCVNPSYYFGVDSPRPFEADFVGVARYFYPHFIQAIGEADLVLHATAALFDPPPPSMPRHHQHVGPMWWEPSRESPGYLDRIGKCMFPVAVVPVTQG